MTPSTKQENTLKRIISLLKVGPRAIALRYYDQIKRIWRGHPDWKYSEISPNLYLGGQHRPKGWQAMEKHGITAVVNMREDHYSDLTHSIGGKKHLHLITRDNTPPKLEDLVEGVKFISQEIDDGGKVYIHCGVGVGRAPTMTAAYLISTGMSPDEAMKAIQKVRPFVHLTGKQRGILDEFADYWQKEETQAEWKAEILP